MSPLPFSHLTNEIVDLTMDTSAAMRETGDTWTMFMGVVVTLLPKIIPMVMPVIMGGDEGIKERFGGDEYEEKIEAMFRNKMLDNLEVIEGFIRAWKNDNLSLNDVAGNFGINANFIQSKSDDPLFAGEPLSFQNELLNGIQFIQERISRSDSYDDHITKIANRIWNTARTATEMLSEYLF